jgi:hypothetical protein
LLIIPLFNELRYWWRWAVQKTWIWLFFELGGSIEWMSGAENRSLCEIDFLEALKVVSQ